MNTARRDQHTTPWAVLTLLLVRSVGPQNASRLLEMALEEAHLASLPSSAGDVVAFVRNHLLASFVASGPGLQRAIGLLEQLEVELWDLGHRDVPRPVVDRTAPRPPLPSGVQLRVACTLDGPPSSSPPPPVADAEAEAELPAKRILPRLAKAAEPREDVPFIAAGDERRPRVLLLGTDALERASLARALVWEGFDARSAENVEELEQALRDEVPRLAVVDLERRDAPLLLAKLAATHPAPALVLCANDPGRARAAARNAGLEVLHVYSPCSARRERIQRIRECVAPEGNGHVPPAVEAPVSPLRRIPRPAVAAEDLGWLSFELEGDAAEFLANVDGRSDIETIAGRCGLVASDGARIAAELAARGTILLE
jgi:hypothetical protein